MYGVGYHILIIKNIYNGQSQNKQGQFLFKVKDNNPMKNYLLHETFWDQSTNLSHMR